MAKIKSRTVSAKAAKPFKSPFSIYWTKQNYILLIAGVVLTFIGFFFLSGKPWDTTHALVIAPIILFVVYTVIFPLSILYKGKQSEDTAPKE